MPTYEFGLRWNQLLADRDRALERSSTFDLPGAAGRVNSAMGGLGHINNLVEMRASYISTYHQAVMGIEQKGILDEIRAQLAPNQAVRVLIDRQTNAVKSIERPGAGLLGKDDPLRYFPLVGDDHGVCRGDVIPDTTEFTVHDGERRKSLLLFDYDQPKEPEEPEDFDDKGERNRARQDAQHLK